MNPLNHLYYRNLSQKLELQLEHLEGLFEHTLVNLIEAREKQANKKVVKKTTKPKRNKKSKDDDWRKEFTGPGGDVGGPEPPF